jgi:hypothetical protein
MKYVMIAFFTVSMGLFGYIFVNVILINPNPSNQMAAWLACIVLLLASSLSIGYASVLGCREDRLKKELCPKEMELLQKRIDNCF